MKKFLVISLLAATTIAGAQTAPAAQPADAAQTPSSGQQQVVIKDQAEYQAYESATGQADPAQKAQALEAFLQQYPNTVVKKEALENLLATYQKTQNAAKLLDTAQRILQVEPTNEQALLVVAFIKSTQAQQAASQAGANQQAIAQQYADAAQWAQKALDGIDKLQKPATVDDAGFQQQKNQIIIAMNATIGLSNYLAGNFQAAVQPLFKAVQLNPQDVADMEYLGVSMAKPNTRAKMYADPEAKTQLLAGVFWLCKAVSIAPPAAKPQFTQAAQYYYNRFHGSQEGFEACVQQAASMPQPSPEFKITPVPSPQEQVAQVLASTAPDQILVKEGFDTWESILTLAQAADAQKVWEATKGKPIELSGVVMNASASQLQLAVSEAAQTEKRADVTIQLKAPLTAPPAVATADYAVVGIADSYTAQPAFMLTLTNGAPKAKAPAKKTAPAHHAPAHRATTRRK